MEKKSYFTGLILKYLGGEILPSEEEELTAWLKKDKSHQALFKAIQSNWHSTATDVQKAETAYQKLAKSLQLPDGILGAKQQKTTQKTRKINTYWLRIAATFTGLLLLSATAYYLLSGSGTIPGSTLYKTGYGETATFVLPDNSVVTLNANSSLKYNANWQQQEMREVWLTGEAFFHVSTIQQNQISKLPARFVVHTSQMNVEVLGTQFNVNERRGKTTVVLNSGKVKLNSNLSQHEELAMKPGDYVELSAVDQKFIKKIVDPEIYSSWKDQKLILDNTSLGEIAQIIEDNYGLKVVFEDVAVAKKTLTGSIPTDDLNNFLTVLSASIDIQIQREGNKLILSNKEAP